MLVSHTLLRPIKRSCLPLIMERMPSDAPTELAAHGTMPTAIPWLMSEVSTPKGETFFAKSWPPHLCETQGANYMQGGSKFHVMRSDHRPREVSERC